MERMGEAAPSTLRELMTPNPVIVDRQTSLDEALAVLGNYGFRHLLVVELNELIGLVSDRDLRLATGLLPSDRRPADAPQTVGDILRAEVVTGAPDEPIAEAVRRMVREQIGSLPIVSDGAVVGIVTETDLLEAFSELAKARGLDDLVRHHMKDAWQAVSPDCPLLEAEERLVRRTGHLLVMEGDRVVGIVSERDLLLGISRAMIEDQHAEEEGREAAGPSTVAEIMTREVVVVNADQKLTTAVGAMLGNEIGALPVVERKRLVGLLTQRDLLEYYASIV
jgi:CBS domain-containing protein